MTTLDLSKNISFPFVLGGLVRAVSAISIHDTALVSKVQELKNINSAAVDYERLKLILNQIAAIVQSYNKSNHVYQDGPEKVISIPETIHSLLEFLEESKTQSYLSKKYFSLAELEQKIENFAKLAGA